MKCLGRQKINEREMNVVQLMSNITLYKDNNLKNIIQDLEEIKRFYGLGVE